MIESIIFGALVIGVISGSIPLVYGINKDQIGMAIGGFFACVASGLLLGAILAFPMAGFFFYLIKKRSRRGAGN